MSNRVRACFLFLLSVALPCAALGNEEAGAEHEHRKNELGVFVGLTHERRENGVALGIEYERRLTPRIGIGAVAERTWGDFDFWVYALPVTFHFDAWKIAVAPGVERFNDETGELIRLTLGHEFQWGESLVTPNLSIDFIEGDKVYVLGATFGFGF